MSLKHCILLTAKYCGLFALSRRLTARKVRILAYHGIWLGDGHFGNFLYMNAETFARRMALLRQWGYPVIPLQTLSEPGRGERPDAATVITIDDGWYGTYRHMLPALEAQDFSATIYLTTYYCMNNVPVANVALQYCFHALDSRRIPKIEVPEYQYGPHPLSTEAQRRTALDTALDTLEHLDDDHERQSFLLAIYQAVGLDTQRLMNERWFHLMNSDEVRDTAARGFTFELHTHRHRITDNGANCLGDEIAKNRDSIQALTGQYATHFCYPSGVYNPAVWPELEAAGVASATTTEIGFVDNGAHPFALPRILDGEQVSELEFEAEMSGFLELVRRMRGWSRRQQQSTNTPVYL